MEHRFVDIGILGRDNRFVQALRKTKEQFDRRCSMIVGKQKQLQ